MNPKDIGRRLSQEIDDFDFDVALPPPPGFQDNLDQADKTNEPSCSPDDVTIIETKANDLSSLTPDCLSLYIKKEIPQKFDGSLLREGTPKKPLPLSRSRFDHSTPSSQAIQNTETLGFSPIQRDEIVKSFTSLSNPNHSSTLMTSTPKQRSILNYVRPSQTGDTEDIPSPRIPKTRPCIACTRLNGGQLALITKMTDRKLAIFSSVFNMDVTHMIVAVDEKNRLRDYTVKFVAAVAAGLWVLRYEWVQECLNHNCIVPEVSRCMLFVLGVR